MIVKKPWRKNKMNFRENRKFVDMSYLTLILTDKERKLLFILLTASFSLPRLLFQIKTTISRKNTLRLGPRDYTSHL